MSDETTSADTTDFDRHRRRVLWSLPTGLYLIGSRHGERSNLMTANLVVQVCLEPKLVAVAVEAESVTAGLVTATGWFTISLLDRADKDVIRRFVKPVPAEGQTAGMLSGHAVTDVGPDRLPVLTAAIGWLSCRLTQTDRLGSHTLFIGAVEEVGGEPADVLRMEDTRMHYGG
ncbi:MAG TPA: flavin reductase family protein [Acidimicrobiales bacterium]|jgi:flavin reductase (DIM6/NTAB) family NADH-FMN oxidoreductase RutF|nr:flavin reductase family protein [Acidimicrobiales bacterium]